MGAAALENGFLVGFLGALSPFGDAFGNTGVKGVYTPVHAHGVTTSAENRKKIYKLLYQAAAKKWTAAGAASHAVTLYAGDKEAVSAFFEYGFGLRCIDAMRPMIFIGEDKKITGVDFYELTPEKCGDIAELRNALVSHLGQSPCFIKHPFVTEADCLNIVKRRNSRVFCAGNDGAHIAFIEICDKGENFACSDPSVRNICGAFCLPQYRGTGLYRALLNYVIDMLKCDGYTRLSVDYESLNPTALGFWQKYFTPYTSSVVRRIDEKYFN